ncbi:BatD family protein [Vibrio gallaecicus]|uniref:BatD family protein n=1 Tax=Vibrio gallaecicus TaxID=552386 RepID=A0ABV4NH43_9VIBR
MPISKHLFLTFFLGLLSLGLSINSAHAATTASASVTQNKVTKDEVFVLRVSVNEKVSSDALTLDALTNDFYIGRPSFGSSMNIINGTRTVQSEWTVTLAPLRAGSLTIPSFNIEGAKTRPIPIKVSINKLAPTQSDMAEFELELNTTQLYPSENGQLDVTLVIKADPRRLQNPQIAPPSSILSKNMTGSNSSVNSNNITKAKGLEVTPIGDSKQYQDVRNGVEVTIVQQSFSLSSSIPGDYTLIGPKLTGSVVYSDNRSSKTRLFQLDTPVKTFAIKVLPIPSDYKGSWLPTQQLTLNQAWEDSTGAEIPEGSHIELNVGDSLTRTITMSAKGIAQHQLPNLSLTNPETVRVYDEKPKFGQTESGDAIVVFQQVLIPKKSGSFTLPAVTQTWFNTTTKTQETSSLAGLTFTAIANASETAAIESKQQIQPSTSEAVTVTDAGIWPYISLMFALLWVGSSTIAFHFWKKKPNSQTDTKRQVKGSTDSTQKALIHALEKRDGLQVEAAFEEWRNDHKNVAPSDLSAIQKEIKSFTSELYSKKAVSNATWTPTAAIKLIRKQKASKSTAEESVLEKL